MKSKRWLIGWGVLVVIVLGIIGSWVYKVDPYFHYHAPLTDRYFYKLNNQRSQNNGISKHFKYDALITGTSMTENFKTSEMDKLFGVDSIKLTFSGGTYKEVNDNLITALDANPELHTIVRGLDTGKIFDDKDRMRFDLGEFPMYLYDDNPFNDVKYLFNRDVIWARVYPMVHDNDKEGFAPGITTFDDYARWQDSFTFGINSVCPKGVRAASPGSPVHLTDADKKIVSGNIEQNVVATAKQHPEVTFYYFFTPYSVMWWRDLVDDGTIYRQIEAEECAIEQILSCDNIKLFSFNNRTDITADMNNYKDDYHYGQWINSLILRWIHDGQYQLTEDNYKEYLSQELDFYLNFDYSSLNHQEDYEGDYYAEALLNKEINGVEPVDIIEDVDMALSDASIVEKQYKGKPGIRCQGTIPRDTDKDGPIAEYLMDREYIGAKIELKHVDDYRTLVFYGKKVANDGQPTVVIYNDRNEKVQEFRVSYKKLDNEWHQYTLDISKLEGDITVIFNGGYINKGGKADSGYIFSDISMC